MVMNRFVLKPLILVFVSLLFLASCSNDDEPTRQLTPQELAGTAWNLKEYAVKEIDGKYELVHIVDGFRYFIDEKEYTTSSTPPRFGTQIPPRYYSVVGEVYREGGDSYKIVRYTGDSIEMIDLNGINSDIAQKSGYGFRYKYVLTKI